jgi:hypothetical protein
VSFTFSGQYFEPGVLSPSAQIRLSISVTNPTSNAWRVRLKRGSTTLLNNVLSIPANSTRSVAYADTAIVIGTTYSYEATVYREDTGATATSSSISPNPRTISVTAGAAAPVSPNSISVSTSSTDGIQLSWSGASGSITNYGIYYGFPEPTSSTSPIVSVSASPYFDTTMSSGSSRTYWVRAQGPGGNGSWEPSGGITGTRAIPGPSFTDTSVTGSWVVGKNYSLAPDRSIFASDTSSYSLNQPTSGTFPTWLSINSSGQLSGIPTQSGTFTFRVTANGLSGTSVTSSNISIVVYNPVSWIDETLADGIKGVPYSDSVSAANATAYSINPTFNLSVTGLSFNAVSGLIAGTPKEITSYTFTITASNPGDSISKQFTISFKSGGKRIENTAAITIGTKKRFNSSTGQWVDITTAKRWNSATNEWRDISN